MSDGTPLYQRTIDFYYGNDETRKLVKKVWSVTPFMVACFTDSIESERYREIMQWCGEHFGQEAWPIHGRPGDWQRGGATVYGNTNMGFATEAQMNAFIARWPDPPPTGDHHD